MSDARDEMAVAILPTRYGDFRIHGFSAGTDEAEPVALVKGEVRGRQGVPVRVHSECLTGDVLGSRRCDCRAQLESSLAMIEASGCGALIYLRQEGRGIGLFNKIKAYHLQDLGRDTVQANLELGFADDGRSYHDAARLIRMLGILSVKVITNNLAKIDGLRQEGIVVEARIPLITAPDKHNAKYLETKAEKLGHLL